MKIVILMLSFFMVIAWADSSVAQDEFSPGLGIAAKSSTNGFGGDAVFNFNRKMSLRLGFEKLALASDFSFEEESVEYDANVDYETGSLSLLFDYYLAKRFFITAGAGYNMFHAVIEGKAASSMQYGDIQISKDKIGDFNFQIDPTMQISPYAGIGFGRTLGLKKKVGFSFEMGGFYQGSPDFTIASTGLLSPTSNPDQAHEARLEKQVNQYTVYPVLKFSLSYKIANF